MTRLPAYGRRRRSLWVLAAACLVLQSAPALARQSGGAGWAAKVNGLLHRFHAGKSQLQLSGGFQWRLSRGCHQLKLGQGKQWDVRVGEGGTIRAEVTSGATLEQGRIKVGASGASYRLHGVTIRNPAEVSYGLYNASDGGRGAVAVVYRGLRRTGDKLLDFDPKQLKVYRAAGAEDAGKIDIRLDGKARVGRFSAPYSWERTFDDSQVKPYLGQQRGKQTGSDLKAALSSLSPADGALLSRAGNASIAVRAEASSKLRAGKHTINLGQESCQLEFARGNKVKMRVRLFGETRDNKPQFCGLVMDSKFDKPVTVCNPTGALRALTGFTRGGRALRALSGLVDRCLSLQLSEVRVRKSATGGATTVTVRGSAKLPIGHLPFKTSLNLKDATVQRRFKAFCSTLDGPGLERLHGQLAGLLTESSAKVEARMRPRAGSGELTMTATPKVTGNARRLTFEAPVTVTTPGLQGSFNIKGRHDLVQGAGGR